MRLVFGGVRFAGCSGACDCVDELPHRSSCSQFVVCGSFCCGWYLVVFVLQDVQELATVLMNYHIGRLVLSSSCVGAFVAAGTWWCSF